MTILYHAPGAASVLVHWLLLEPAVAHELRAPAALYTAEGLEERA